MSTTTVPMLTALNLDLRNEYAADCEQRRQAVEPGAGGRRPRAAARTCRTRASTARSARSPGTTSRPTGEIVDEATWEQRRGDWLPTAEDRARVAELMVPHYEPGRVRRLDLPAVGRHQLAAGRVRLRPVLREDPPCRPTARNARRPGPCTSGRDYRTARRSGRSCSTPPSGWSPGTPGRRRTAGRSPRSTSTAASAR